MRHQVKKHKRFNQKDVNHKKSMLRNILTSLFIHKKLTTTLKRAKATAALVDGLVLLASRKNSMNAIRQINTYLFTAESSLELFKKAEMYKKEKRDSGFVRITPVYFREGDSAKMVVLELI